MTGKKGANEECVIEPATTGNNWSLIPLGNWKTTQNRHWSHPCQWQGNWGKSHGQPKWHSTLGPGAGVQNRLLGKKPFYKERPVLAFGNPQCTEGLRNVGLCPLPPATISRVQFDKT